MQKEEKRINNLIKDGSVKERIIYFIQRKVKEAKAKGIIIGLSGGIDSSVVGVLGQEAVGKENMLGVTMPCNSIPNDLRDAMSLINQFDITYEQIDFSDIYKMFTTQIYSRKLLALINLKARLRMCILYYIANSKNYIVLGTGNRTEIEVGYLTKYGDGGIDCEPIGDLLKRDVIKLAKYLKIPKRIITKAPSAGLYVGQEDEKELGLSYKELDSMLAGEVKMSKKVKNMIKNSEHKRVMPKVCEL